MGYYISKDSKGNPLPATGKVEALLKDGAKVVEPVFQENLVCVVENGHFDAAGYAFDKREFKAFSHDGDPRKRTWLVYEHAAELSDYRSL